MTTTTLNPYLGFLDSARPAMEFYQGIFGGDLAVSTFAELHASEDPAEGDKLMHARLTTPSGFTLMASDTPNAMSYSPGGPHSVSLSGDDEGELRGYWEGLSDGATVAMALEEAPWGDTFGMLIDKFGVSWMVNIVSSTD
jgi:PhnB protein